MPRVDDYAKALELALEELRGRNLHHVSRKSMATILEVQEQLCLEVPFIDKVVRITMPEGDFVTKEPQQGAEVPIQEKILILHYLNKASGTHPEGQWITYREIPSGEFYYSAFVKRAVDPLKKVFGEDPEKLKKVAPLIGGQEIPEADVAFSFKPLPLVPLKLLLWKGDEEFPPEGNVLFDHTVSEYLSAEDIAWLAGMVVYRLIALSKSK